MSLTSIGILYPKPLVRTMEMCGSVVKRRGQPNLFLIMYPNSNYLSASILLCRLSNCTLDFNNVYNYVDFARC